MNFFELRGMTICCKNKFANISNVLQPKKAMAKTIKSLGMRPITITLTKYLIYKILISDVILAIIPNIIITKKWDRQNFDIYFSIYRLLLKVLFKILYLISDSGEALEFVLPQNHLHSSSIRKAETAEFIKHYIWWRKIK